MNTDEEEESPDIQTPGEWSKSRTPSTNEDQKAERGQKPKTNLAENPCYEDPEDKEGTKS